MNAKQTKFVAEYLIDLNATQAAIRAGYSAKTAGAIGHENLNKPEIAQEIASRQANKAATLDLSFERVLLDLEEVRSRALQDGQYSPAVKAIELRGKHLGMFIERTENDTRLTVRDAIDRPPNETRDQWIARRQKELLKGPMLGNAD